MAAFFTSPNTTPGTFTGFILFLAIILLYRTYTQARTNRTVADTNMHQKWFAQQSAEQQYNYQNTGPSTMTGHDFEHYCANLLRQNGYMRVQVTKASGDDGVDIIAERDGIKHAIQTKYYAGTVGNSAVQQVHAGRAMYQCAVGIVMTNSTFTKSAIDTAARLGIVLWDGKQLNLMAAKVYTTQASTHHPPPSPPQ